MAVFEILNGPNVDKTGSRETDIYGAQNIFEFFDNLGQSYSEHDIESGFYNSEADFILALQNSKADFLILNPGAYTHTSLAIADAVRMVQKPMAEVHISNIYAREAIRQNSLISEFVQTVISGAGLVGYKLAIDYFLSLK